MKKYKNIKTFDELIEVEHGKAGSEKRNLYDERSQIFIISEMMKKAHKINQEKLAEKAGTKKNKLD